MGMRLHLFSGCLALLVAASASQYAHAQSLEEVDPRYGFVKLMDSQFPNPFVFDMRSGGNVSASEFTGSECAGYLHNMRPDFRVFFRDPIFDEPLTFLVDGPSDSGLVINDPHGVWFCNDDAGGPDGLQPAVVFEDPSRGQYDIWVTAQQPGVHPDVRLVIDRGSWRNLDDYAFGDDSAEGARDGWCTDPRFGGINDSDRGRDASDCLRMVGVEVGFGDNTGEHAFDGECDDPIFGGTIDSHRARDATDCGQTAVGTEVAAVEREKSARLGTELTSVGTSFFVSRQGHALTNNHVAGACNRIVLRILGQEPMEATVLATDVERDLALLKVSQEPPAWAKFREGRAVRQGDEVVVYGFPIPQFVSAQGNLTAGLVTALSGGADLNYIQVSAQAGPGNSGGPVMDRAGNVVGVLSGGLDSQKVAAEAGGYIPQNMNFAVRGSIARIFLDNNNVDYETGSSRKQVSIADIGDRARGFTAFVECYR